jgi:hypothetical protein
MADTILYGLDSSALNQTVIDAQADTLHKVVVSGLSVETTYYYKIRSAGDSKGPFRFRTPPRPSSPFRFVVYGDPHNWSKTVHHQMNALIKKMDPHVILTAGDLVPYGGNISGGGGWDYNWVTRNWADLAHSYPVLPAIGNHDEVYFSTHGSPMSSIGVSNYSRIFSVPDEHYRYYSKTLGNCHFTALHSFDSIEAQGQWLMQNLALAAANPDIQWKFATFHVPMYNWGYSSNNYRCRENWEPAFKAHSLDMTFSGHWHYYQRIKRVSGGGMWTPVRYDPAAPFHTVTGGGSGGCKGFEMLGPDSFVIAESSDFHFICVTINGSNAHFDVINVDGDTLDSYDIRKGGTTAQQRYTKISDKTPGLQIWPNPVTLNKGTPLSFFWPRDRRLTGIKIYNIRGNKIADFPGLQAVSTGSSQSAVVKLPEQSLAAGIYVVRGVLDQRTFCRKLVVTR